MAKTPKQVPHWMVLVQVAHAAGENAKELIIDAEALLAAGRWPSAYALAVLAHEEFRKANMAMAFVAAPPEAQQAGRKHSVPHATCGLSVVLVGGGRRFAY